MSLPGVATRTVSKGVAASASKPGKEMEKNRETDKIPFFGITRVIVTECLILVACHCESRFYVDRVLG
jgi:hypothetical protein